MKISCIVAAIVTTSSHWPLFPVIKAIFLFPLLASSWPSVSVTTSKNVRFFEKASSKNNRQTCVSSCTQGSQWRSLSVVTAVQSPVFLLLMHTSIFIQCVSAPCMYILVHTQSSVTAISVVSTLFHVSPSIKLCHFCIFVKPVLSCHCC